MSAQSETVENIVVTRLVNSRAVAIKFYLEPWGEEYEMPPAASFEVVARGPVGDGPEVTVGDDSLSVWGWPGSVLKVFFNGSELGVGKWERAPVPPMPSATGRAVRVAPDNVRS